VGQQIDNVARSAARLILADDPPVACRLEPDHVVGLAGMSRVKTPTEIHRQPCSITRPLRRALMSAWGQTRAPTTSSLPSTTDLGEPRERVCLVPKSDISLSGHPKDLSYNSKPRGFYLQARRGTGIWPSGRYHQLNHGHSPAADSRAGSWPRN
jgi:hypothetical protein